MRSMFMLAALAAVIGFTGCCGTGGSCKLGNCHLGSGLGAGKALRSSAGSRRATRSTSSSYDTSSSWSDASMGDCGCGASGGAAAACGGDSVISVSAPYVCDGGCAGGSAVISAPASCGCSSCDGGGAVEYTPAQSSGCSSCDSASTSRGLLKKRSAKQSLSNNKGLGLLLKGKGKACESDAQSCSDCDTCSGGEETIMQTVAQMPGDVVYGGDAGGRRISTGIISDIRGARGGHFGHRGGACGVPGCGIGGKICRACSAGRKLTGTGHPYGGVVPHTNPAMGQQPQSGIAPQYAYPYYTTRGPRDFLRDNPPSIGY